MAEFVSLTRSDERFIDYLKGTFSSNHRAFPQKVLYKNSPSEEIVFRVQSVNEITRPSFWRIWLEAIRPAYLTFTLSPLLAALSWMVYSGWSISFSLALTSFFGALFLQIAAHLFNDYFDHVKGVDGQNSRQGVLQKGFLSAFEVLRGGRVFLGLGVFFGLPALWQKPFLIFFVAAVALLGVLEFSSNRLGLKYRGLGEVALYILAGPLLLAGFVWTVSGSLSEEVFWLGGFFGFLTAYVYHLKNLEEIMADAQSGVKSLVNALGFDRSQFLATYLVWAVPLSLAAWAIYFQPESLLIAAILLSFFAYRVSKRVANAGSFMSSDIHLAKRQGLQLHFATGLLIALAFLLGGS